MLYHNYPWRDMHCPSMTFSLDICQVMNSRISIGDKVYYINNKNYLIHTTPVKDCIIKF